MSRSWRQHPRVNRGPLPFQTPYPRPARFSDPHSDFYLMQEELAAILDKHDDDLDLLDFRNIFQCGLPAADYGEGTYFLPIAFRYMAIRPDDSCEFLSDLIWFIMEHDDRLSRDGLLEPIHDAIRGCFEQWTSEFHVSHFDRAACQEKGWGLQYHDYVENSGILCALIEELVRRSIHADWADELIESIAARANKPIQSAWFLGYTYECFTGFHKPRRDKINALVKDRELVRYHADIVLETLVPQEESPTYWSDVFLIV